MALPSDTRRADFHRGNPSSNFFSRASWLSTLGLDTAKFSLMLYVLGLFSSSFYYSRFSILTLDFAKTQSILVGLYVLLLYAAVPTATIWGVREMPVGRATVLSFTVPFVVWTALGLVIGNRGISLMLASVSATFLQFVLFVDLGILWRSLRRRETTVALVLPPGRGKTAILALLFCMHFSEFWFPGIPAYFGGGRPIPVQVFTRTSDLPASRFVNSKDQPQINTAIDSFSLRLLYESGQDIYFISDLEAGQNNHRLFGHASKKR